MSERPADPRYTHDPRDPRDMRDTRMCPYCAEEVRAEAIKCKHCGSRLDAFGFGGEWTRSRHDRMIAGVCGGLAARFGLPTALLRLAFVLMTLFAGGVGIVVYLVLWVVMPLEEWPPLGTDLDRLDRLDRLDAPEARGDPGL